MHNGNAGVMKELIKETTKRTMDHDSKLTAETIERAIESIITHFSQEIHLQACSDDYDVPYFDALLGRPLSFQKNASREGGRDLEREEEGNREGEEGGSSLIHYWVDKLIQFISSEEHQTEHDSTCKKVHGIPFWSILIQIQTELLQGYESMIRPKCIQIIQRQKPTSTKNILPTVSDIYIQEYTHLILIQYEILIQQFKTTSLPFLNYRKQHDGTRTENITFLKSHMHEIQRMIQGLVQDILYLTSVEKVHIKHQSVKNKSGSTDMMEKETNKNKKQQKAERKNLLIQNWILPTLLHILQHAIQLQQYILESYSLVLQNLHMPVVTQEEKEQYTLDFVKLAQVSLQYGTVAASTFCPDYHVKVKQDAEEKQECRFIQSSNLSIFEILPKDWKEQFTIHSILKTCAYSPFELSSKTDESNDGNNNHSNDANLDHNKQYDYWAKLCHHDWYNYHHNKQKNGMNYEVSTIPYDAFLIPSFDDDDNDSSMSSNTFQMKWLDHTKGIGHRAAYSLLQQLDSLSITLESLLPQKGETNAGSQSSKMKSFTVFGRILGLVEMMDMFELLHANFFGRLEHPFKIHDRNENHDDDYMSQIRGNCDTLAYNGISIIARGGSHGSSNKIDEIHQVRAMDKLSKQKSLQRHRHKALYKDNNHHKSDDDMAYNQIKARIVTSVRLFAALKYPNVSTTAWSHALPIIYSLIDSMDASYQALGGALFLHLLNESTPTSFLNSSVTIHKNKAFNSHANELIDTSSTFEMAMHILSMILRTCDNAISLSVLYSVQRRLFEVAKTSNITKLATIRRVAVSEILTWIQQRSYCGPNGESGILSALTVALTETNILLGQIASEPNAEAIEVGRLGLCTLLPLIRWNSTSLTSVTGRRIQTLSLCCLISLMMGAYPMMERHGEKIMTELLSCVGRALNDLKILHDMQDKVYQGRPSVDDGNKINEKIILKLCLSVSIHASSVASILCGKQARSVLEKIENGNYMQELTDACNLIILGESMMQRREKCTNLQ